MGFRRVHGNWLGKSSELRTQKKFRDSFTSCSRPNSLQYASQLFLMFATRPNVNSEYWLGAQPLRPFLMSLTEYKVACQSVETPEQIRSSRSTSVVIPSILPPDLLLHRIPLSLQSLFSIVPLRCRPPDQISARNSKPKNPYQIHHRIDLCP